MKKICSVLVLALISCSNLSINTDEAKSTSEKAIQLIGERNYEELYKYYSEDFRQGESKEAREAKFNQVLDAVGPVVSFKFLNSSVQGDENGLLLNYEVQHQKLNTIESYSIVKEDGKCLISKIDIQQKSAVK